MIFMNDFKTEPEALRMAELAAAERVLRSGWYVLGTKSRRLKPLGLNGAAPPIPLVLATAWMPSKLACAL